MSMLHSSLHMSYLNTLVTRTYRFSIKKCVTRPDLSGVPLILLPVKFSSKV